MIPIHLDPAKLAIALVGVATLAERRVQWLRTGGALPPVFSPSPSDGLRQAAGRDLIERYPNDDDLARLDVLWIADIPLEDAHALFARARAQKVIVNVEDVLSACLFHTPALVRRGRLTISIGTGGSSPAVAGAIRERIEAAIPPAWGALLEDISHARQALIAEHAPAAELLQDARARIKHSGL